MHAGDPVHTGVSRVSSDIVISYYQPKNELMDMVKDLKEKVLAKAFDNWDDAGHQTNDWTERDRPCAAFCTYSSDACCAVCAVPVIRIHAAQAMAVRSSVIWLVKSCVCQAAHASQQLKQKGPCRLLADTFCT